MTTQEYLASLLAKQEFKAEDEELKTLHAHKEEIAKFIQKEFGSDPVIKYAGSYAKGTMIKESYDLDVVCYFPSTDERTLKEIHDDVKKHLEKEYLIEEKTSAVRILNLKSASLPDGYHIDVVPGRFIEGSSDVFLHVTNGERDRMQTNLKVHINHITSSGCEDAIKLAKLWNCRNNLTIKTFVLELFVIDALSGFREKSDLSKSLVKIFEAFRDNFQKTQLIDPANSANIVSALVGSSHKALIAQTAKESLLKIINPNNLSGWQAIFAESNSSISSRPATINNPSGQWSL